MAITSIGSIGSQSNGGSSHSTLAHTLGFGAVLEVGNVAIVVVAKDNTGTTDADHAEVSLSDTQSNTWTKLGEWTNGEGGAGSGVTCSVWMSRITTEIPVNTGVITATYGSSVTDSCMTIWEFGAGANLQLATTIQTNVVDASTGFGSASFSGLASVSRLYLRGCAKEANSTTDLTASSGFTRLTATRSRNNAAAILVRGEFLIATSTGETSNPTHGVSGDSASVFVALEEVASGSILPHLDAGALSGGMQSLGL